MVTKESTDAAILQAIEANLGEMRPWMDRIRKLQFQLKDRAAASIVQREVSNMLTAFELIEKLFE